MRRDPDEDARTRAASLPRWVWIVAGTDSRDGYPCRCSERLYRTCSAAWCPCAGQEPDGRPSSCCSWRFSPADVVMAKAAWELKKRAREELMD